VVRSLGRSISDENWRETYLGIFGPLSLVSCSGVGNGDRRWFRMMHWGLETPLNAVPGTRALQHPTLYMSGTTFFHPRLGDVTPMERRDGAGRARSWMGFGFLAAVISYLPAILYQAFSRREVSISLLDARAGLAADGRGLFAAGTVMTCGNSGSCSMTGNAGQQNLAGNPSFFRFWPTFVRSTRTSRGWRR